MVVTGQHQRRRYPNVYGDIMATADASGTKDVAPVTGWTAISHAGLAAWILSCGGLALWAYLKRVR